MPNASPNCAAARAAKPSSSSPAAGCGSTASSSRSRSSASPTSASKSTPRADLSQAEPVTLLLHKPPGYHTIEGDKPASQLLTAANLWAEDASGLRPLKKHFAQLTLCVPLETDASGLVVFTQDWRVARKLTEDAATLEHEVIVEVAGELAANGLKRLNRGIPYHGKTPPAIKVSWQNETRLRVALKGAQPGQIAHLCEAVGLQVLSMKRIRLGRVPLGKLPAGQWRYLREDERF